MYKVLFSKAAIKDAEKIKKAKLAKKAQSILEILLSDPVVNYPPYEKLVGELQGFFSRRINIQHRIVYEVSDEAKIVKVLRMWTHYE
jgi:Txe/YoeB family toxin of toxin-antitoxin system